MIRLWDTSPLRRLQLRRYNAQRHRQVLPSPDIHDEDQADGDYADLIMIEDYRGGAGITPARLQTKVPRSYGGGTIRMQAQFYYGAEVCELKEYDSMWMRLGIGMTRDTAKWFYIMLVGAGTVHFQRMDRASKRRDTAVLCKNGCQPPAGSGGLVSCWVWMVFSRASRG